MLGLLSAGFPRKTLALSAAVAVLATLLITAPMPERLPIVERVPVIGELITESADAHTVQNCTTQWRTRWVRNSDGSYSSVSYPYRSCVNVPHAHPTTSSNQLRNFFVGLGCLALGGLTRGRAGAACFVGTSPLRFQD